MREFYGVTLESPLMLGTARYPSPAIMGDAFKASRAGVATVSLRRESGTERAGQAFWKFITDLGVRILPNTAGCHTVKEAVTTAQMAREIFDTSWIKLEVIGNADTLQPDVFGLVEAARILTDDGFQVFPYTTEDLKAVGLIQIVADLHRVAQRDCFQEQLLLTDLGVQTADTRDKTNT